MSSPSGSDGEKEGALFFQSISAAIDLEQGWTSFSRARLSPSPDGKFEAAWMDSDDEREAAKLNQKPSGHSWKKLDHFGPAEFPSSDSWTSLVPTWRDSETASKPQIYSL